MKRQNETWSKVTFSEYGVEKVLQNLKKGYTLLHDATRKFNPYVVAWSYCEEDNTWGQGHYFQTLDDALNFMFA